MKGTLTQIIEYALDSAAEKGIVPGGDLTAPTVEITRDRRFGDYATNIAMVLASAAGKRPRDLAEWLVHEIRREDSEGILKDVQVAGPGFINFTMSDSFWTRTLKRVLEEGSDYARTSLGEGRRVQVEFVSANPTGPLHVGHGRGAALGDALANILECAGYEVQREYYINDAGNQILTLGTSVYARYLELCGRKAAFPEQGYRGDYIRDIAGLLRQKEGDRYLDEDEKKAVAEISEFAARIILEDIREDLQEFGVEFQVWFSERSLVEGKQVEQALEEIEERGHIYREEGATWFRSTVFGDDKDRVVIKADGSLTYFASDLAYHRNKFERGFDRVINIWGADHHGYVARLKAGAIALGRDREDLQVLLVQLVTLLRKGQPVAMSTRAGEFVTLREVREEVGRDAARFIFLTRKPDSKLDFDLDLAKEKSNDNPVYYVQYAHARICSILRNAQQAGLAVPDAQKVDLSMLSLPEEKELIRLMAALPDTVEGAALAMEPHRLTIFLRDMATALHNYYFHHRVISDEPAVTSARLALVTAVRTAVAKALDLLGVAAPERM